LGLSGKQTACLLLPTGIAHPRPSFIGFALASEAVKLATKNPLAKTSKNIINLQNLLLIIII
jgi:hypothetical protein